MPASVVPMAWLALAALPVSAVVTGVAITYARRRGLLDEPGRRRSHAVPTPRGGGIGIVVALLACIGVPLFLESAAQAVIPLALVLVAAVGWIDDHRPLSARVRLAVHALAAALVFATAMAGTDVAFDAGTTLAGLLVVFLLVASINLHNFMDGIDGLLAVQAIFTCLALTALSAWQGDLRLAGAALIVAAAVLGFLPFNFPRARIFMGDVGSGSLGFAIGLLGLATAGFGVAAAACVAIAGSAFAVDAGATLLSRMLHGRRWYSAHREHLYQWLVRSGRSHARVTGLYLGWNLLVATPVIGGVIAGRASPALALAAAAGVYALGFGTWMAGKRHCLREVRQHRREHRA